MDWLECTLLDANGSLAAGIDAYSDVFEATRGHWTYTKAFDGYKHAARSPEGMVILTGREDMGAHLVVPGAALAELIAANMRTETAVGALVQRGANFSRVDCAVDVADERMSIRELQKAFINDQADTRAKENNLMGDGKEAITWYLGSWKSDHFLRVYNKFSELARHAEVPDTKDWIRVELVNRDKFARLAADLIYSTDSVPTAVRTMILSYIDFPHSRTWTRALHGPSVQIGASIRTTKSTRRWLEGPVATSLARELVGDPGYRATWDRALESAIEAVRLENEQLAKGDYPT